MTWSKEQVNTLLEEYAKHTLLYDTKHPDYHYKQKRGMALKNILDKIPRPNTTVEDLKKKLYALRANYITEKSKYINLMKNGQSANLPSIFYYDKMKFIDDYITIKAPAPLLINIDDSQFQENVDEHIQNDPLSSPSASSMEYTNNYSYAESPKKKFKIAVNKSSLLLDETTNGSTGNEMMIMSLDDLYGTYIGKRLQNIKNKRRQLDIKYQIEQIFYKAECEECED